MDNNPLSGKSEDKESLLSLESLLHDAIQLFHYAHVRCESSFEDDCMRISLTEEDEVAVTKTSIAVFDLSDKVKKALHDALHTHTREYKGIPLQRIGRISVFYLFTLSCHYFSVRRCITKNKYHPADDDMDAFDVNLTPTKSRDPKEPDSTGKPSVRDLWARLECNYTDLPSREIFEEGTVRQTLPQIILQPLNSFATDIHWSDALERVLMAFEWHARPLVERHHWVMTEPMKSDSPEPEEVERDPRDEVNEYWHVDASLMPPDASNDQWLRDRI